MMVLSPPAHTEVVDQRPVPAIERFLDRGRLGWNLASVSTVLAARAPRAAEEDLALEHMQLSPAAKGVLADLEMGEPLRFNSRPGDFDFDPAEE